MLYSSAHDEANPCSGPFVIERWIALALIALGAWLVLRAARAPQPAVAASGAVIKGNP